jgi:hypothetical protein
MPTQETGSNKWFQKVQNQQQLQQQQQQQQIKLLSTGTLLSPSPYLERSRSGSYYHASNSQAALGLLVAWVVNSHLPANAARRNTCTQKR